jgi:8-oxo-dGTP diphosphatase
MPKPNDVGVGTALIVINSQGLILLGKRKGAHRAGHWACPGGWIDRGDENTVVAVARETLEETGLVITDANQLCWTSEDHPELGIRTITLYHVAPAMWWTGTPEVKEPNKCEAWDWFYPGDLPTPLFPGIAEAVVSLFTEAVENLYDT